MFFRNLGNRLWIIVAILLVFPGNSPKSACGQTDEIFQPAPRALQQMLKRAEEASAEQAYPEAVEILGRILAGDLSEEVGGVSGQDYFVQQADQVTRTSVKAEALRLLAQMPKRGQDLYELKYGSEAARLLEQAIADSDVSALAAVARKFFHTRAGRQATFLLGRLYLDRGEPLAAALCFHRLENTPAAKAAFDPELTLFRAAALLQAGRPTDAGSAVESLARRLPRASVQMGGQPVRISDMTGDPLQWLRRWLGASGPGLEVSEAQWVMFLGNPERNALSHGGLPLMNERWRQLTVNDPKDAELVDEMRAGYDTRQIAAIPVLHPLVLHDQIIMRTTKGIVSVSLATGKRIWNYPWMEFPAEDWNADLRGAESNAEQRKYELNQRLWEDLAYGQLSSDGTRVFMLEMGIARESNNRTTIIRARNRRQPTPPESNNQLVALSVREQGKLQWIVGGPTGEDEPKLAGAFFLGPPVPVLGELLVLVERPGGEIQLVSLDPRTGRQRWFQQIAHMHDMTISFDRHRRLAGATPSYADGIVVCPTATGTCVGIDLANRSLLWGYQYGAKRTRRTRTFPSFGKRWADGTPFIADGCAVLTPIESGEIHCVDLLTGKPKWDPKPRDNMLFVAGIHQGRMIVVGQDRVSALRVSDGEPAWSEDLDLHGALPSGRGFWAGEHYYLPTTTAQLLKIDTSNGKVVRTAQTHEPLGNLVAYKDQLISHHVDWLRLFYQVEPLRSLVAEKLRTFPDNAEALTHLAQLQLHDGDRQAAIATLQKSYELDSKDDLTHELLINTVLDGLKDDFVEYREAAAELFDTMELPVQRWEYQRLVANGHLRTRQWPKALDQLLALLPRDDKPLVLNQPMIVDEPGWETSRDRWLVARLDHLFRNADPATRQRLDERVRQVYEAAIDDPARLRFWLVHFAFHPRAQDVRLQLATRLVDGNQRPVEADLLLSDVIENGNPTQQAQAIAQAIRMLYQLKQYETATPLIRRLHDELGSEECLPGLSGQRYVQQLLNQHEFPQALEPMRWGVGEIKLTTDQTVSRYHRQVNTFNIVQRTGAANEFTSVSFEADGQIRVRDGFGQPRKRVSAGMFSTVPVWSHEARLYGHQLLVSAGSQLLMVDLLQPQNANFSPFDNRRQRGGDVLRWKRDISSVVGESKRALGSMTSKAINGDWGGQRYRLIDNASSIGLGRCGPFLSGAVYFQKLRKVYCVDPLSGQTLWSRGPFDPGSVLIGNERHLIVIPPEKEIAYVLDAWDGSLQGERTAPPPGQRWMDYEGHLVTAQRRSDALELSLLDPVGEQAVWTRSFAPDAQCCQISRDEIGVVETTGTLTVFRIKDGNLRFEAKVDPEPRLEQLLVQRTNDQYLVAVNRPGKAQAANRHLWALVNSPLVSGKMYAFDRQDGHAIWQTPAVIESYGWPQDQPNESPLILFLRGKSDRVSRSAPLPSQRATAMCIDKLTGELIMPPEQLVRTPRSYKMLVEAESQQVVLMLDQEIFAFEYTDNPRPPAPPLQMPPDADLSSSLNGWLRRLTDE